MEACSNITFLISLAIPLTMIIFGAKYINSCPIEPFIPIYMIGAGGLHVLYALIKISSTSLHDENGQAPRWIGILLTLLGLTSFGWFIAGNVWVYGLQDYSPRYGDTDYCNHSLYLFAFWIITLSYILLGVFIVLACCSMFCVGPLASCFLKMKR